VRDLNCHAREAPPLPRLGDGAAEEGAQARHEAQHDDDGDDHQAAVALARLLLRLDRVAQRLVALADVLACAVEGCGAAWEVAR
jgi:hypothetical protein